MKINKTDANFAGSNNANQTSASDTTDLNLGQVQGLTAEEEIRQLREKLAKLQGNQNTRYTSDDGYNPFEGLGTEIIACGFNTDTFNTFVDEFNKVADMPRTRHQLAVKVYPITQPNLKMPLICISSRSTTGKIVVYSVLIESMLSEKLVPEIITHKENNTISTLVYDITAANCYDTETKLAIIEATCHAYGLDHDTEVMGFKENGNGVNVVLLSGYILPKEANMEDKSLPAAVFNNAWLALKDYIGANDSSTAIDARRLTSNAAEVRLANDFTPGASYKHLDGEIVASDLMTTLDLVAVRNNNRNNGTYQYNEALQRHEVHGSTHSVNLARATMLVDFCPSAVETPQNVYYQQQPSTKPGFQPQLIITSTGTTMAHTHSTEGLATQLLSLVTATNVASNYGWVRAFEVMPGRQSLKKNIGLLGIEHCPWSTATEDLKERKVSTVKSSKDADSFTPIEFARLWCNEYASVAIDITECGRTDWYQSVFLMAAMNVPGAKEAIIEEADRLTNNHFSGIWNRMNVDNPDAPIVLNNMVRVHLGTYQDEGDIRRDLRTIDYLSILERSNKDIDFIIGATMCQIPGNFNQKTLTDRREIICQSFSNVDITGIAHRVYVLPAFLSALTAAMNQCGIRFRTDGATGYLQTNNRGVIDLGLGFKFDASNNMFTSFDNPYSGVNIAPAMGNPAYRF